MNQSDQWLFIDIWRITSLKSLEDLTGTNDFYNLGSKQSHTVKIKVNQELCNMWNKKALAS